MVQVVLEERVKYTVVPFQSSRLPCVKYTGCTFSECTSAMREVHRLYLFRVHVCHV